MFELGPYLAGLVVLLIVTALVWVVSLIKRDASIVDPLWSMLFLAAAITYAVRSSAPEGARRTVILVLVAVWALRLSIYLLWRAWGEEEDYRYQSMRRRQGPNFPMKSLVTVFWFQGVLAWLVSAPLLAAVDGTDSTEGLGILAWLGIALWAVGLFFEAVGDWQLARFKADPANKGQVLDAGVWRLTRHPNYFGDFAIWWVYFLIAADAGGWWSIYGSLLMSFLLLRVSGVAMLERTITKRRPGYEEYIRTTNAFFPGPKKTSPERA